VTTTTTVLLVDDYPDALDMWALYLQLRGYSVSTAGDGISALKLAQSSMPDVMVLDLELPGLTGLEVARALRRDAPTAAIPLIAVTGHSLEAHRAAARDAGFDAVLVKPCDPDVLIAQIERLAVRRPASESE